MVPRSLVAILILVACLPTQTQGQGSPPFSGYCDTVSNPGQQFVLYGLGERFAAPYASGQEYTACTFGPGSPTPSIFLGEGLWLGLTGGVWRAHTLKNLYVKQTQAAMGGTVNVWVNPKVGGLPIQTPISCTLAFSQAGFYACSDTSHTYQLTTGDRVIAIVTPPLGQSISPVSATLDLIGRPDGTGNPTMYGSCGSVSFPGLPFVLNGLGQRTSGLCNYGPGSPNVSVFLGETYTGLGSVNLANLRVKQQQLNSAAMGGTVSVWLNPKTGGLPNTDPNRLYPSALGEPLRLQ